MNRHEQGLTKQLTNKKSLWVIAQVLTCVITFFAISCKSDLEKVNLYASELNLPDQSAKNLEVEYTDTGKLQLKFITPVLKRYSNMEEPYYEFPEGIRVEFYNEDAELTSVITSNYSIYNEITQIWEARDSVVAKNIVTGELVESEQMFWDQPKQKIYSNLFTKITNEDGIYFGEKGFEAAQDLSSYRLLGSSGTVRVQDEE